MKTFIVTSLMCGAALIASATDVSETAKSKKVNLTPEKKAAMMERVQLIQGGPKIVKPGSQKGAITIVNAQKRASAKWLAAAIESLRRESDFNIVLKDGAFNLPAPEIVGEMTIYVADDTKLPRVLIAPEDRWGMVNVAPLHTEKSAFFEARVKKELARGFSMLCGGMTSNYKLSLVGAIVKPEGLDVFPNEHLPVDILMRMPTYMEAWGVTPAVKRPYKIACQEGWAPQPTNKVMQAIWDEVHAVPTNPIVIKPETKKQK